MNSGASDEQWQDDPGSDMFPVTLPLQYRVCESGAGGEASQTGSGHTVCMSSSLVQFESEETLRVGLELELSIAWPAKLNESTGLTLRIKGRILRSSGKRAELKTEGYEFYTRLHKQAGY